MKTWLNRLLYTLDALQLHAKHGEMLPARKWRCSSQADAIQRSMVRVPLLRATNWCQTRDAWVWAVVWSDVLWLSIKKSLLPVCGYVIGWSDHPYWQASVTTAQQRELFWRRHKADGCKPDCPLVRSAKSQQRTREFWWVDSQCWLTWIVAKRSQACTRTLYCVWRSDQSQTPPSILRKRTVESGADGAQHKSARRVHFRTPEAIYIHDRQHCSCSLQLPFIIGACILMIMGLILYCHHSQLGSNIFNSSFVVFILRLKHNAAICWNFLKKQQ